MSKRFLLIDDDEDDHEILITALKEIDGSIRCYTALSGQDGLEKLDDRSLSPDLIFLDLNMPGMTGFDVLRELKGRKDAKNIPVIIFSTSSNPKDIRETQALGAFKFITKPSRYSDLRDVLKAILLAVS